MRKKENIFKPFNFSSTRCFVATIDVKSIGYLKIEYKMPVYVRKIKAIYVSTSCTSNQPVVGFLTLNFNGQALKIFQCALYDKSKVNDYSLPMPFEVELSANSFMQGYYFDKEPNKPRPYQLKIYFHYTPE